MTCGRCAKKRKKGRGDSKTDGEIKLDFDVSGKRNLSFLKHVSPRMTKVRFMNFSKKNRREKKRGEKRNLV